MIDSNLYQQAKSASKVVLTYDNVSLFTATLQQFTSPSSGAIVGPLSQICCLTDVQNQITNVQDQLNNLNELLADMQSLLSA
jgi:hypothetical protein